MTTNPGVDHSPISSYGIIGDTRTAALVSERGSVDWMCLPHFDGDPVFARLIAGVQGGTFALGPVDSTKVINREYEPATCLLRSTWQVGSARVTLVEGMIAEVKGTLLPTSCMVRRIEVLGGDVRMSLLFDPRFGEDRHRPRTVRSGSIMGSALVCADDGIALGLTSDMDQEVQPGIPIEFELNDGATVTMALSFAYREPLTFMNPAEAWDALLADCEAWRAWTAGISYDGPFIDAVQRSAITLRMLTYSPSGAPVAAPSTSLPEHVGGSRNWDYRFAWPRDASIGLGAFLGIGLDDQAGAFLYWLLHASRLDRPRLKPLLTLHGRRAPQEREIDGWPGWRGSLPVRVGNGARDQHQLDSYGWVLDAMWLFVNAGHHLYDETWRAASGMTDLVAKLWRQPDAGVWEIRDSGSQRVHSKLMAWLTLDRALLISETHRVSQRRRERWITERDAIAIDVRQNGFDEDRCTYVGAYGHKELDAAVLVLPLLGIEPPDSPRVRGTVSAIRSELSAGGPLLYRYRADDGLAGDEGAFLPCSFWAVQALAKIGEVEEATELFNELLALAGPLGLFAEEVEPTSGEQIGNYPQAFTHATLIQAALAIRDASGQ
ncbi:MAG TPA: glycoside hydrolase family 15 protein [Microthrixaceae bacterium]|nr:glycoside hydrolase family 15 protein [Microthrixaceae bacterium]